MQPRVIGQLLITGGLLDYNVVRGLMARAVTGAEVIARCNIARKRKISLRQRHGGQPLINLVGQFGQFNQFRVFGKGGKTTDGDMRKSRASIQKP